jgi:hypothetical protein
MTRFRHFSDFVDRWKRKIDADLAMKKLDAAFPAMTGAPGTVEGSTKQTN